MSLTLYEVLTDQPIFIPKAYEFNYTLEAFKVLDTVRFIKFNGLTEIVSRNTKIIEDYFDTLTSHLTLTEPELQRLRDWKDFVLQESLSGVAVHFYCSSADYQLGDYKTIYVRIYYAPNKVAFFIPGCTFQRSVDYSM
jgi:hypothetical protein